MIRGVYARVFDKDFCSVPSWLESYMPTALQSTMMDQSYSISIEGLNHVAPKWSNRSSKVGHLVVPLGQWCAIVAYQILWCTPETKTTSQEQLMTQLNIIVSIIVEIDVQVHNLEN